MKNRFGLLVAAALAITTCPLNVQASATDQYELIPEREMNGNESQVDVQCVKGASFTVTLPKKIDVDTKSGTGTYNVSVTGDIAPSQAVYVTCDQSFTISDKSTGKSVEASAKGDKEYWYWEDAAEGEMVSGTVKVDETLAAGNYEGTLRFTIDCVNVVAYEGSFLKSDFELLGYDGTEENVVIPETVDYGGVVKTVVGLEKNLMYQNHYVKTLVLPDTLKSIPDGTSVYGENGDLIGYTGAFSECTSLKSVHIPDSVTYIGDQAFSKCNVLTDAEIPAYVEHIGTCAFAYTGLASINIPETLSEIAPGAFGKTAITAINIPDSVTTIGAEAFAYCENLISVDIPDSVTSIEMGAFHNCTNLASVTLPEELETIEEGVFIGCKSLTDINIPESVTSIGRKAFMNCTNLTSVTIPDSLESIEDYAFYGCSNLKSIVIPESVESIGEYAFRECVRLTSAKIKGHVTEIPKQAFYGCSNLTSVTLPDTLKVVGENAFRANYKLTSVDIPDSVTEIKKAAFYGCSNLASVDLSDSLDSIRYGAFNGCKNLTSVDLPDSLRVIEGTAFAGTKITSAHKPANLTSCAADAFPDGFAWTE